MENILFENPCDLEVSGLVCEALLNTWGRWIFFDFSSVNNWIFVINLELSMISIRELT